MKRILGSLIVSGMLSFQCFATSYSDLFNDPNWVFNDDFSAYSQNGCHLDGFSFGPWNVNFASQGCVQPQTYDSAPVLYLAPAASTSPTVTHSALVTGPSFSGDIVFEANVFTNSQLRQGSVPNSWEVGWLIWDYTDNKHFYYFILKPNGWELGKVDPSFPGGQGYLQTGDAPLFPIQNEYLVRIVQQASQISIFENDTLLVQFKDTKKPFSAGKIGLYTEDSSVYFSNVRVGILAP